LRPDLGGINDGGMTEAGAFPQILIITGAMAAGKSTVAQGLAERLERSVHLRGDVFRRMIVSGRVDPTPGAIEAWRGQLRLRHELAWMVADRYARDGFTVIYQDILNEALTDAVAALAAWSPGVVVLCPTAESLSRREAGRGKSGYKGGWTPAEFDLLVRETTPRIGLWLDSSALTAAETVGAILANPEAARAGMG
jgi:chloramphenicol 3-O-phosphotransferase